MLLYLFIFFTSFQVEKHSRIIVSGDCWVVGPGGYLAGGGIGLFDPALGLGVDNVLEIKVCLKM